MLNSKSPSLKKDCCVCAKCATESTCERPGLAFLNFSTHALSRRIDVRAVDSGSRFKPKPTTLRGFSGLLSMLDATASVASSRPPTPVSNDSVVDSLTVPSTASVT